MEEGNIIAEMLRELHQKTLERKVIWKIVNANAIRWIKREPTGPTTVIIQKRPSPNSIIKENYSIAIQSKSGGLTEIESGIDPYLKEILAKIFDIGAKESKRIDDEKKIETIKNLLKGL